MLILGCWAGGFVGAAVHRCTADRIRLDAFEASGSFPVDSGDQAALTPDPAAIVSRLTRRNPCFGATDRALIVADCQVDTARVSTPIVDPSRQTEGVRYEAERLLRHSLEECYWDYHVVSDDGIDLDTVVFAVERTAISQAWSRCAQRRFRPQTTAVTLPLYCNAYRFNYPDAEGPALLVIAETRNTHLIWIAGNRFLTRTLPFGRGHATPEPPDEYVESLTRQVEHSVAANRRLHAELRPERIITDLPGTVCPALVESLETRIRLPVEQFDPLRRIDCGAHLDRDHLAECGPLPGAMIGHAAAALLDDSIAIDLTPAELSGRMRRSQTARILLGAATLCALAAVLPAWRGQQILAHLEGGVREAQARAEPLAALKPEIDRTLGEIESLKSDIAGLQHLMEVRHSWIRLLVELQDHMSAIEDVWLDSLAFTDTPDEFDAPRTGGTVDATSPSGRRLRVEGRMLDRENPLERVSIHTQRRVNRLLALIEQSPSVARVHERRFDTDRHGILQFTFVLELDAGVPL